MIFRSRVAERKTPFQLTLRSLPLICFFGLMVPLLPALAMASDKPGVKKITLANTRDNLLLYCEVKNAFRKSILSAVNSGAETTFSYFITAKKINPFQADDTLVDIEVTHTLKYDTLKKEYTVKRSWRPDETIVTKSIEEAKVMMTKLDGLRVLPLDILEKGERYRISVKIQLEKVTLPYYLDYILFFVSLWNFETDWYSVDFMY